MKIGQSLDQQGISKRFLNFMHSLDTSVGARTLGPEKTISGQIQQNVQAATQQVNEMDERQGYSKRIKDVSCATFFAQFSR
jgi:hypothetical protein